MWGMTATELLLRMADTVCLVYAEAVKCMSNLYGMLECELCCERCSYWQIWLFYIQNSVE